MYNPVEYECIQYILVGFRFTFVSKVTLCIQEEYKHYKDTSIQLYKKGYTDTRIQGYKDTRIQEYKDTRIQGYKDTRIQGYKDTRIQ